jgi:23S rRNA G2445 N2-methylase RlmL
MTKKDEKIEKIKNGYFASCPTGLEELLAAEIKSLRFDNQKYEKIEVVKGGVHIICVAQLALELMLASRIASRVYKKMYEFEVKEEKDLYKFAKQVKWKAIFDLEQTFKISVVQGMSRDGKKRSQFKSSIFLSQNFKDGIVDKFRLDCNGERPNVDKDQADMGLLLRVAPVNDEDSTVEVVTVLVDMCGAPLSHRGYRDTNFSAPLKENLAAGLVMLSGYTGEETFVDPMCGSSTIIIESLLIKGKIPPSYLAIHEIISHPDEHYWDFTRHNWFKKDKYILDNWKKLIELYNSKAQDGFEVLEKADINTFASDKEKFAINASEFNLKAADLLDFVSLEKDDATEVHIDGKESGILVTNPPYGERIGEDRDLPELYYNFGENMKKNFTGFTAYVFTGNLPLLKKISLRTSKKHILYNGSIEARLAEYKLF